MNDKKFWHKAAFHLTEQEVRYAMANSTSNRDAAAFLHISIGTYKRYAEMFYDHDSGKNLFELHRNQSGRRTTKPSAKLATIEDIFAGKHPKYPYKKLAERLIREGWYEEKCALCSFSEKRISDYTTPLVLTWKNGNKRDHSQDNMEFVCYNCYHLYYGNMKPKPFIILEK